MDWLYYMPMLLIFAGVTEETAIVNLGNFGRTTTNEGAGNWYDSEIRELDDFSNWDVEDILKWCESVVSNINGRTDEIEKAIGSFPLKNKELVFEDEVKAHDVQFNGEFPIPVADEKKLGTFFRPLEDVERDLEQLREEMDEIGTVIENSIDVNETKTWPDNLHLSSVVILEAVTDKLYVKELNGYTVPRIDELIPFKDPSVTLNLNTTTFSDIDIIQDFKIDSLNGEPLSSYVTVNRDHFLEGHVTFDHLKTTGMKVGGLIDGTKFDEDSILLRSVPQTFRGQLKCSEINVQNLITSNINNVSVFDLMQDTAIVNSSIVLNGDLTINGDLKVNGRVTAETVDGLWLEDLAKDAFKLNSQIPQIVNGKYEFEKVEAPKITISNTLNSVDFRDSIFVNAPVKNYNVRRAKFDTIHAERVYVGRNLNEIGVNDGKLDLFLLNKYQVIKGRKRFEKIHLKNSPYMHYHDYYDSSNSSYEKLSTNKKILNLSKLSEKFGYLINKEDDELNSMLKLRSIVLKLRESFPRYMYTKLYKTNRNYTALFAILSGLTSEFYSLNKNLEQKEVKEQPSLKEQVENLTPKVVNLLNMISRERPLDHTTKPISNFKSVLRNVLDNIDKLIKDKKAAINKLRESLNEIDKELDDVTSTKSEPNVLSPHIRGSLVIGLVNGFNLRNLLNISKHHSASTQNLIKELSEADRVIFKGGLNTKFINNVDIRHVIENAIPLSSPFVNAGLIFQSSASVQGDLSTPSVNGVLASQFATTSGTNVFRENLNIWEMRVDSSIALKETVNDYDLRVLSDIAFTDSNQKFKQPVVFSDVHAESISAGRIFLNSVPLEDYVLKNEKYVSVTGLKTFKDVRVFSPLTHVENLETNFIDGVPMDEFSEDSEIWRGNFTSSKLENLKSLKIKENLRVDSHIRSFDESDPPINLERLYEATVQRDKAVQITGSMTLNGNVWVKKMKFSDSFDGVNANEFANGFVLNGVRQEIYGSNFFQNLTVKNLFISDNYLQDINLKRLNDFAVKIDEPVIFPHQFFFNFLSSDKEIVVEGLVQGWNLTRDAVITTETSVITGMKTFRRDVLLARNFLVKGRVNGVDLSTACRNVIGEVWIQGPAYFAQDVVVKRLQKGRSFFPDDVSYYWVANRRSTISGSVVFNKVLANNVTISEKLNNEPIIDVLHGRLTASCRHRKPMSGWQIESLTCDGVIADSIQTNRVNGQILPNLKDILLQGVNQTFQGTFRAITATVKDLRMTGTLNGQKLDNFCRKNERCYINAEKHIYGNLMIIGNWKISDQSILGTITVDEIRHFPTISANVIVKGSLLTDHLSVNGSLQGIKFDSEHIMTLSKTQVLNGALTISNPGRLTLKASVMWSEDKTLNDIRLPIISANPTEIQNWESTVPDFGELFEKFQVLLREIAQLQVSLRGQASRFDGWNLVSYFPGHESITPLQDHIDSEILYVALISRAGVQIMSYSTHNKSYKRYAFIELKCTTDAKGFRLGDKLLIATSTNCPNYDIDVKKEDLISPENTAPTEVVYSYLWEITKETASLHKAIATNRVSQTLCFEIYGSQCVMFVRESYTWQNVLCENKEDDSLVVKQRLNLGHVSRAAYIRSNLKGPEVSHLIVATNDALEQDISTIKIYRLSPINDTFLYSQTIASEQLVWITTENVEEKTYLVSAHKPFVGSDDGFIRIFRLETDVQEYDSDGLKFNLEETIHCPSQSPLQVTLLQTTPGELMLFVLTCNDVILRYVKKGFGKFHLTGTIPASGAKSLISWIWNLENIRHLAIVKSSDSKGFSEFDISVFEPLYSNDQAYFNQQ